MSVRPFTARDIPQLLQLMRGLAEVEDYLNDFNVTDADLHRHGLGPDPLFHGLVYEMPRELAGMAICYLVPWTYSMRPRLVLKELFVAPAYRQKGVATALFQAACNLGRSQGAEALNWTVMQGNTPAEVFYRAQSGVADTKWNNWTIGLDPPP